MKTRTLNKWAVKWRAKNKLDGVIEHFVFENYIPVLFFTKREAIGYIKKEYGYLKTRKDLREEPFGWQMPMPVKVKVKISEVKK